MNGMSDAGELSGKEVAVLCVGFLALFGLDWVITRRAEKFDRDRAKHVGKKKPSRRFPRWK